MQYWAQRRATTDLPTPPFSPPMKWIWRSCAPVYRSSISGRLRRCFHRDKASPAELPLCGSSAAVYSAVARYGSGVQTLSTQSLPAGHCVHAAVHWAPVVLSSGAQVAVAPVPHRWKPVLQARTQVVPLQVTVPFVGGVHVVHVAPQASMLSLSTQVGAAVVPRRQ